MGKRDIVTSVILTFITCGIYGIIWFVGITDDVRYLSEDNEMPSGITCLLLVIFTCGLYGIYWNYKMGEKLALAGDNKNVEIPNNGIAYLILCLIKFDIIGYVLMQNDINKILDNAN